MHSLPLDAAQLASVGRCESSKTRKSCFQAHLKMMLRVKAKK